MNKVAPFAGAWIEIIRTGETIHTIKVAPFAGAWIEMVILKCHWLITLSRSVRRSVD